MLVIAECQTTNLLKAADKVNIFILSHLLSDCHVLLKMDIRKYSSKKRPREDESQDDDTDVDVLTTHYEGCSTNLTAKALAKRRFINQSSPIGANGSPNILGYIVKILKQVCFAKFAKSLENRRLLLAEHGHLVVYLIGTMARKSLRHIMIPSRIKMLL